MQNLKRKGQQKVLKLKVNGGSFRKACIRCGKKMFKVIIAAQKVARISQNEFCSLYKI